MTFLTVISSINVLPIDSKSVYDVPTKIKWGLENAKIGNTKISEYHNIPTFFIPVIKPVFEAR